eukprot:m.455777 g.455777  ORF g.455777 m.455777 type:complete len:511 (+) comp56967_c0_seq2:1279-2811(+)
MLLAVVVCVVWGAFGQVVQTTRGPVLGLQTDSGFQWKGIPFAAPPVNNLRFQPPVAHATWNETRTTRVFGPICPQACILDNSCGQDVDEDCLYLNVFTPLNAVDLPVMFWIHGGSYYEGAGGMQLYDGSVIANSTNVVVVTINYRLGALGFLVWKTFAGNYGMLDQRFAMQWVQENIRAFGGDPNRVTIFGESAGAISVGTHMVSEGSWPYFNQTIMESNPAAITLLPHEFAEKRGSAFLESLCHDDHTHTCLFRANISSIIAAQLNASALLFPEFPFASGLPFAPNIDDDILLDQPLTLFNEGRFKHTPSIIGDVGDEDRMFIYQSSAAPVSYTAAQAYLRASFSSAYHAVKHEYPIANDTADARPQLDALISDYGFLCPSRNISMVIAASGMSVFRFLFTHPIDDPTWWGSLGPICNGYACHSVELPFVFASFPQVFGPDEAALSNTVIAYWGAFAHTGDPNTAAQPKWPRIDTDALSQQVLNVPACANLRDPRAKFCDFWDATGYNF